MKRIGQLLSLALLLLSSSVISQELDIEFGEIDKSDLEMTVYQPDSSASAVVLYDYGHSYFNFNTYDYTFDLTFETHVRIKILNKDALDRGTFEINLYEDGRYKEEITRYKGYTFNLEKGKIVKSKLKKSNRFIEEVNSNNKSVTYTFPDVKVGSVIDFTYTKTSDFDYNLESWFFQSDIPVVWSEYEVEIPEYYHYNKNTKGYIASHIYDESSKNRTHTMTSKSRKGLQVSKTSYTNQELSYYENNYRIVYKDVPAFKNERFIGAAKDYISHIDFELESVKYPNSTLKQYSTDYESIGQKLLDSERYGSQLNSTRFLKDQVNLIQNRYTDPTEQMQAAYSWVQNNIKWDGYNSLYAKESIKDVYRNKEGRAGGVNLLLTTLLRALDINAYPVALSTRSNGILPITHPSVTSFNYTIAYAKINGKEYLLDATEKNLPINQLPSRCLNGKGRIISDNGGKWIELKGNTKYQRSEMIKASINSDGELIGKRRVVSNSYAAFSKRNSIEEEGGIDNYFESYAENDSDYTIENYTVDKYEEINSPLIENMDISLQVMDDEDIVYFNPLLYFKVEDNPFVQEKRDYPVDFSYISNKKYILQMEIPEGYEATEIPEKIYASLPNNAGKFTYQVVNNGNNLMVISQISLNKQMFLPNEYNSLKLFFKMIVDKHSEVIVFKKTEV